MEMTRIELINALCEKIGAKRYLEIGIREGEVLSQVRTPVRVGVDPRPLIERLDPQLQSGLDGVQIHPCESDVFFAKNTERFDIVFVDGLHLYEQAIKDILNAFNVLSAGGFVVVHDLLPGTAAEGSRQVKPGAWNGDVWKVMHDIHENHPQIKSVTVDSDFGMGVLWTDEPEHRFDPVWRKGYPRMPFSVFEAERDVFMTVLEPDWSVIEARIDRMRVAG
ncbi:class I SAM-dependent methyltransferase [uncultured Pseudodesulfovibrio sp.]|uniref:class I SAM-dependent methyltransferase n=1 Tax=uncultured Pseudodesulfovibrio sp. TaxID=2035858 RepID=UPI0029C93CDE|nr:class I SAM-dependent methyltransferase [uncultured Pseudodesulfovibrio sp.]